MSDTTATQRWVCAAKLADVEAKESIVVQLEGHTIALFPAEGRIFAIDNRCPHMGFPLDRGSVKDCVLTCHWHQARFDLATGGTFDLWADDVRAFPVEIRGEEVWVDLAPQRDMIAHYQQRLKDGLERNISLILGKSVLYLLDRGVDPTEPFRIGLEFGTHHRQDGWGQGLTMLTCLMNMLPALDAEDRPRALFHGLSAVANDCAGSPTRFLVQPLPDTNIEPQRLKRLFRQFIEVRDSEGAERCIVSAIRAGGDHRQLADMLFAAVTDHRYIQVGHPLDFTNKAFEALDIAGWEYAEATLTSLVSGYAGASRMEESNAWRHPIDLVALLESAFERLPERPNTQTSEHPDTQYLIPILMGDDPHASVEALLNALQEGATAVQLAGIVACAAALRIARFHTSNEFGDWDRALHTFTFANAVHQGLRRAPSPELLRGVFDAAMSLYLDRFLNVPPARLLMRESSNGHTQEELLVMLNQQQQVNAAGGLIATALENQADPNLLLSALGKALLREDRNFHTIQMIEAAFRQFSMLRDTPEGTQALVAAARYLAAHAPTMRAQGQTYQIAQRLHRGEKLFEEA